MNVLDDLRTELEPAEKPNEIARSILIIDDDIDQAEVLRWRLESQGYEALTATTGREGYHRARSSRPDLILLDLRLPDVDGFSVCEQLGNDSMTAAIPVIMLSGMDRPDIIRRARSVGSQYYVRKPYDPNVLLVLIQNTIGPAHQW